MEAGPDCDNLVVAQGSCLQLTCSSRPRGTLTWTRPDGQPIRTQPPSCSSSLSTSCPQSVSGDGNMVLNSVTPEDAGYYICTASFLNQTAMKICRVSVAGEVSKLRTEIVPYVCYSLKRGSQGFMDKKYPSPRVTARGHGSFLTLRRIGVSNRNIGKISFIVQLSTKRTSSF